MIDLVTPAEAKAEAAKGLKQAIAVSIKKFEGMLTLECKDIDWAFDFQNCHTCGLCQYKIINEADCDDCVLSMAGEFCCGEHTQYDKWSDAGLSIADGSSTTITQFHKETRKMIKILKKLYKEQK